MIRPAGSSAALLMRRPLESFCVLALTALLTLVRFRSEFSAVTLVLICNPILSYLLHDERSAASCHNFCSER